MQRETFLFTKTLRDIKSGFDLARETYGKIKTTADIMRGGRKIQPKINERHIAIALEQEKRRFARQCDALERGREKVEAFRQKLAGTLEKNKRLMALRYELQKQYWAREDQPPVVVSSKVPKKGCKAVKLSY